VKTDTEVALLRIADCRDVFLNNGKNSNILVVTILHVSYEHTTGCLSTLKSVLITGHDEGEVCDETLAVLLVPKLR
jgi:hypothetical protein